MKVFGTRRCIDPVNVPAVDIGDLGSTALKFDLKILKKEEIKNKKGVI
jgi:hypothetical protein